MIKQKTEIAWSPIKDTNKKNINSSPIWKQCWKEEEMNDEIRSLCDTWYKYTVKFDGLKAIHCTDMKVLQKRRDGSFR